MGQVKLPALCYGSMRITGFAVHASHVPDVANGKIWGLLPFEIGPSLEPLVYPVMRTKCGH